MLKSGAVTNNDVKTISRTPGIGKKTAERLILEIKDKLPRMFPSKISVNDSKVPLSTIEDAISALINLGYANSIAEKAVSKAVNLSKDKTALPSLISLALKNI